MEPDCDIRFRNAVRSTRALLSRAKDVQDVLAELNLTMAVQQIEMAELVPADETESVLLRLIGGEPTHVDEVRRESGMPIATVTSTLAMLELKGLVRQVGRMNYVRAREAAAR